MSSILTKEKPTIVASAATNHDDIFVSVVGIKSTITAPDGAIFYSHQIATDSGFTADVQEISGTAEAAIVFIGLLSNTTYYLRAKVSDDNENFSDWSASTSRNSADEVSNPIDITGLAASVVDLTNDNIIKAEGIHVSWNWARGSGPVTKSFEIRAGYTLAGEGSPTYVVYTVPAALVTSTAFEYDVYPVVYGATYTIEVRAVSFGGRVSRAWGITGISGLVVTDAAVSTDFAGNTNVVMNSVGIVGQLNGTDTFKLDAATGNFTLGATPGEQLLYTASTATLTVPSAVIEDTLTAKTIVVSSSGGRIHSSGKDTYADTTPGFYLGYDATETDYVFNIGDANSFLKWDGSNIQVQSGSKSVKAIEINPGGDNEIHFWGNNGSVVEELATIGINTDGGDYYIANFGSETSTNNRLAIFARAYSSGALVAKNWSTGNSTINATCMNTSGTAFGVDTVGSSTAGGGGLQCRGHVGMKADKKSDSYGGNILLTSSVSTAAPAHAATKGTVVSKNTGAGDNCELWINQDGTATGWFMFT